MFLTLTQAGERIGKSRTIVGKMIDEGTLPAYLDPRSGRRCVMESDIVEYLSKFKRYSPPQVSQLSQPLQKAD
jgi:excisionase family DNA binding protein